MLHFLKRQLQQARTGGLATLRRKGDKLATELLFWGTSWLLVPVVLCVRALRPKKLIRFGVIYSQRIGHLGLEPELYLMSRAPGNGRSGSIDVLSYGRPVANGPLRRLWDRTQKLTTSPLGYYLDRANRLLPGGHAHRIPLWELWQAPGSRAPRVSMRSAPHVSFTGEEEKRGRDALEAMGIADGAPFVCFSAREPGFLAAVLPSSDWDYHDYRDSTIEYYVPAMEELTKRGYWSVRMGAIVKRALQTDNPRIIDYAARHRSEFLDLFLGARCTFFVNDTNGLMAVPMIFRRPVVFVNFVPVGTGFEPWSFENRGLFIPKKLRVRKDGRLLTLRETLGPEISRYTSSQQYERAGLDVIENTPEEILAVTVEMAERLADRWQGHPEDDELQERFRCIVEECGLRHKGPPPIGSAFLREHQCFLK